MLVHWWVDSVTIGDSRFFRPVHRPSLLSTHMYRWLPGLKPTTLLGLCTPKTIHKLTPWKEVRESDSRLQFCRLAYEPLYELPICIGPGGGTQTLVAGATILHFNPLNYSWDIFGEGLRCRSPYRSRGTFCFQDKAPGRRSYSAISIFNLDTYCHLKPPAVLLFPLHTCPI